eukprot:TRINITY_DN17891_c0_g1_i17.p1 TRINITY_DN17891_c0_g1~~TRINITY_DN17891_c0_g1_i17.p1  ORF type:complete len:559 (-),score=50.12 TRINITY_DN17891_c0_g1_i17:313-1848(-)
MSGQLDFRMAALSFQERLARMRRNTDELTANVHRLAEQQENLAGQLREKAQDVDHLAEQCCRADEELHTARIEARDADSRLASAAAAVNKALQRPTPFYVSPSGNTACRSSCAVVSTLRGVPSAEVDAWLRHHTVGLGFCRAYLFYDDPAELRDHSTLLDKYQQSVVAIGVDDDCRLLYPTCYRFGHLQQRLKEDWLARQELHVELALRWSRAVGIQWLLHIDLDELFYLSGGGTAPHHFGGIPEDVSCVQYLNHEGVPELPGDSDEALQHNRFAVINLFRQNPALFPEIDGLEEMADGLATAGSEPSAGAEAWQQSLDTVATLYDDDGTPLEHAWRNRPFQDSPSLRCLAYWLRRTKRSLGRSQYFLAYTNGKGAARVTPPTGNVVPDGVHRFKVHADDGSLLGTQNCVWSPTEAAVLHYANGSFESVFEKLRRLRVSTGHWWKRFALYGEGRDMDATALRALYAQAIAMNDPEEAERQCAAGLCLRLFGLRTSSSEASPSTLYALDSMD